MVVLALAREVGMLRLSVAPRGALEVAHEGPEVGARSALEGAFGQALRAAGSASPCSRPRAAGCAACSQPAIEGFGAHPSVVLRTFDEVRDADAWAAADVPGSPFAVALDADGTVLAKGTFNTGAQLESVLATAERRRGWCARERGRSDRRRRGGRELAARVPGPRLRGGDGRRRRARRVGSLVAPGEAEAYHFCGHIYTTDSCPHPTGLPRIDSKGFPLMAKDARPVDDLGRYIDARGEPVDEDGSLLTDADGTPLPNDLAHPDLRHRGRVENDFKPYIDGAWYRCCGGRVRKLVDCCGRVRNRVNGDKALTGYCYKGRKVFCVMYYDTKVKC